MTQTQEEHAVRRDRWITPGSCVRSVARQYEYGRKHGSRDAVGRVFGEIKPEKTSKTLVDVVYLFF